MSAKKAEEIYNTYFKGRGLAPAHVTQLKAVLAQAIKEKKKPPQVVKKWLKEKGITLNEPGKPTKAKNGKPKKAAEKASEPPKVKAKASKEKKEKAAQAPSGTAPQTMLAPAVAVDVEQLEPDAVYETLAALKAAGAPKIKATKKDKEKTLKVRLRKALTSLTTPELEETLSQATPTALAKAGLMSECLGLYIDLNGPLCPGCRDLSSCLAKYAENLVNGFDVLKPALTGEPVEEEKPTKVKKKAKKQKTAFDPERVILVNDVANININEVVKRKDFDTKQDYKSMLEVVETIIGEDTFPETLGELKKIVLQHFPMNDEQLLQLADDFIKDKVIAYEED